ncbi:MAG TPA: NAD(P)H:quinone oxidoreductase type IV [Candidatus Saccharimonadales bacterium]|nr:NAD(P)H:quinone oxidoreductase type IV [Candidatus Saccharimonadales bacterium]
MKIVVLFHSLYGHVYQMAEAVAEGARQEPGADVRLLRVPEILPDAVLEKMHALEARRMFEHIPVATPADLEGADAVIFGTGTRFGNATASMRAFIDQLGAMWARDSLVGVVGSVFTSSGTQHGGQESTLLTMHVSLLHLGMVVVGLPYSEARQKTMDAIEGGSPYGASTITGGDGSRRPSENELAMARSQGRLVAQVAGGLTHRQALAS